MKFPDSVSKDIRTRLRRVEGQIRGLQRLIDEGAECKAVVTQLSAASAALDRVGFKLISAGLQHCIAEADPDGGDGEPADLAELERLFMQLA